MTYRDNRGMAISTIMGFPSKRYDYVYLDSSSTYSALSINGGHFAFKNSDKTPHSSHTRVGYGVSFVSAKFDRSFATVKLGCMYYCVVYDRDISRVYSNRCIHSTRWCWRYKNERLMTWYYLHGLRFTLFGLDLVQSVSPISFGVTSLELKILRLTV